MGLMSHVYEGNCITFVPELGSPAKSALDDHLKQKTNKEYNIALRYILLNYIIKLKLNND